MKITFFIAGSGGIGQAAGLLLLHSKTIDAHVVFGDISDRALASARQFVSGIDDAASRISTVQIGTNDDQELTDALAKSDVLLDCSPGAQAPRMARLALQYDCHYANLTEYVAETEEITRLAADADRGFTLQTGLAPGFINVLAVRLYEEFQSRYQNDQLDEMVMKVGALSDHAPGPHFYAFTWSPIGVATEYIKDAIVVENHRTKAIPALTGMEDIVIDGQRYQDNYTSGGAADLPKALGEKIRNIHYKTLRHPGHYNWVKSIIDHEVNGQQRIDALEKTMLDTIGHVEDDNVVVYAAVQGKDASGKLRRLEKAYKIQPTTIAGQKLRAIQSTTAAPLCEMAVLMVKNNMKGVILQSQVPTLPFLNGEFVSAIYGKYD